MRINALLMVVMPLANSLIRPLLEQLLLQIAHSTANNILLSAQGPHLIIVHYALQVILLNVLFVMKVIH